VLPILYSQCSTLTVTYIISTDVLVQPAPQTPNFKKDTSKTPHIAQCRKCPELHCLYFKSYITELIIRDIDSFYTHVETHVQNAQHTHIHTCACKCRHIHAHKDAHTHAHVCAQWTHTLSKALAALLSDVAYSRCYVCVLVISQLLCPFCPSLVSCLSL